MAGLFDIMDQMIADQLGVDVEKYIDLIEEFNNKDMEFIIVTLMDNDSPPEKKQRAIDLFNKQIK